MNRRLLLILPLVLGVSLLVPSYVLPSVRAAGFTGTGTVCITPSTTATNCPNSAPTLGPFTVGSTFTIGVFINNSVAMGGYQIYVAANPTFLIPIRATLGTLIAVPSFTDICVNGSAQNGTCTVNTANGPGVVQVATVESSGTNECGGLSPCSGLAFTITYQVTASTPSTPIYYPTSTGCSTSSLASPANTCVLVDNALGTTLPETAQGASVITPAGICITSPPTSTPCSVSPASIGVSLGSSFTVGLRVENSQPLAGFDIYVSTDPNYLIPISAYLGRLIANATLTTRCVNGQTIEGACTPGTANGPGVVEVSTIESSGINECAKAPCSGLAFNITYKVVGATPATPITFPTARGCSTSSVALPVNTCVLVANATGTTLPENLQGANVVQSLTLGHPTSIAVKCGAPIVVGQSTTCTANVTDTSASGAIATIGTVTWTTDGAGSFTPNVCTLSAVGPSTSKCFVQYLPTLVGGGGPAGTGISHIGAIYSGDTIHLGGTTGTSSFGLNILRSTAIVSAFIIVDQTGLPVNSTGVPVGVSVHDSLLMFGGYPVTGAPGTITYTLYPNSACTTGTGTVVSTVPVGPSDSALPSASVAPAAGSHSFDVFYLGDGNNYNVTSACEPFTVIPAPSFTKLHWTHHLSLSKTANQQSWDVTVANPLSTSVKVVVRIIGSSTINPSLTFDVTCGVTCVNTRIGVNFTPGLTPVTIAAGATSSTMSFTQPIGNSFVGQKVTFTVTLYWAAGTLYTADGSASGSYAVVA